MSRLTCISPVDGSVYAERETEDASAIRRQLDATRIAQAKWAASSVEDRVAVIARAIEALARMNDDIVAELAMMMGRPVRYGGEIGGVRERADHMLSIAPQVLAPQIIEKSSRFSRFLTREPLGVVLVVAPWNYPYLTAINTIVPALAAGNAVVLKHSTQTLLAGERFEQAFESAGLPEGLFRNIRVTHDTTSDLIASRSFDYVNFTGSVSAGRTMEKLAAGTFVAVGLELGGKDPAYVRADADLDAAVETLVDGAMFNSGQCCCAIERIYVHDSLFDAFVEKARTLVSNYRLGDPREADTTIGPMASLRFADHVRQQIGQAQTAGARTLVSGSHFPRDIGTDAYLAPQLLIDVDHSMSLMREESFGPVVGIMKVASDEQAIELMNDSPYGLTASIWTEDCDAAIAIGSKVETGTIFMNRCDYLDPALCWTGCKDTGRGASLGVLGYNSVTRPKSYHLKTG